MTKSQSRTKYACFITSIATAFTCNLAPLLFLTFRTMYGISYSLLGLLIVINFGTQLLFDLVFTFFSDKLSVEKSLRLMPALMTAGLLLFGLTPYVFPHAIYFGLTIASVLNAIGGGLAEVLTSPVVAALPSDNPDRLLSRLHSCYAWGVVAVVLITTGYLQVFGAARWMWLSVGCAALPFAAFLLMLRADIPDTSAQPAENAQTGAASSIFRRPVLWLCVLCIFLGGATECTMSQWCSAYLEQAFNIPKAIGDVGGVALFGAMLGLGRSLYGHFGRNAEKILFIGACGASACYIAAVVSPYPAVGLLGCALTGFCASMLWPGSLIVTGELVPDGGVAMFAIMAAGGDLGASVCPQLVGIVADMVLACDKVFSLAVSLNLTPDQLAMKAGLAIACLFPLGGIVSFGIVRKIKQKD